MWISSTACIIRKEEKQNIIKNLKNEKFHFELLNLEETGNYFDIFLKEYYWSPAAIDLFSTNQSEDITDSNETSIRLSYKYQEDYGTLEYYEDIREEKEEDLIKEYLIKEVHPAYCIYLWEKEYDASIIDSVSIYLPSKVMVEKLGLIQKEDGVWYENNEIVCMDFNLLRNSNIDGIYIRKNYLEKMRRMGYDFIWIEHGKKVYENGVGKEYLASSITSLVYINDDDNEFVEYYNFYKQNEV